jgi:tryptophanyl-tRNA synthetase
MSKSYDNAIFLSDPPDRMRAKIMQMITDPQRARRSDPGNPDVCNVYEFHKLYSDQATVERINQECRKAEIGCVDCKKIMAANLIEKTSPMTEKRVYYEENQNIVKDIIAQGNQKAQEIARSTMAQVREAIKMKY